MTTALIIGGIVLAFCWYASSRLRLVQAREALKATNKLCDADSFLMRWFSTHPNEGVSHPEAQEFLQDVVLSYLGFLETHTYLNTDQHRRHLQLLMNMTRKLDSQTCARFAVLVTDSLSPA